jgi:hypothetical protein
VDAVVVVIRCRVRECDATWVFIGGSPTALNLRKPRGSTVEGVALAWGAGVDSGGYSASFGCFEATRGE